MTQMIEGTVLTGEELMQSLPDEMLLHSGYPQITQGTVESGVDRNAMAVPFTIVTRQKAVNRNGNKVQIVPDENGKGGISLVNYARNPIVMLDHGMSFGLPIGVSEDATGKLTVKLSKTKATAVAHFSQVLPEAVQVFALIDEGILRTASISFRPLKGLIVDGNDGPEMDHKTGVIEFKPWMSFDFIESEMLEWSVVGIPADPDAVKKHLDRGHINGERLSQSMRRVMRKMGGESPVQIPGADLPPVDTVQQGGSTAAHSLQRVATLLQRVATLLQIDRGIRQSVRDALGGIKDRT